LTFKTVVRIGGEQVLSLGVVSRRFAQKYLSLPKFGVFLVIFAEVLKSWGFFGKNAETWQNIGESW
jgi:hypothetical protein